MKISEALLKTEAKRHISASQLNTYARCPEAYRRRYIEGEVLPPAVAALKGKSVHVGAEFNFRQKIKSQIDLPTRDIVDATIAAYEQQVEEHGVTLSRDEQSRGSLAVIGEAKDRTVGLATLYARAVAPLYQPLLVEERQEIEIPGSPRTLLGILDLSAEEADIVDLKTGARSLNQTDVEESLQLTGYSITFEKTLGRPAKEIRIEQLIDAGRMQRRVQFVTKRKPEQAERFIRRAAQTVAAIEAGHFPPGQPGWWCSERFCGYWRTCRVRP